MFIKNQSIVLLLIAVTGFAGTFPVPREDFDIPDVYSAVLPKYDFAPRTDLPDHPMVASVTSNVLNSIQPKNQTDKTDDEIKAQDVDENLLDAVIELEALNKLLEMNTQYIENRKKADAAWPNTLKAKVDLKLATDEDKRLLNDDLEHAISAIVIMKMMEERVSFINGKIQEKLAADPNMDMSVLFGQTENVSVIQGLLEFKYFEGLLHSLNAMIDETLKDGGLNSPPVPSLIIPGVDHPVIPNSSNNGDDLTLTVSTIVVLLFTLIGFFFVLFLFLYLLQKAIKKCFESSGSSNYLKKSKYEQI